MQLDFGKQDAMNQFTSQYLEIFPVEMPSVIRIPCQRKEFDCEVLVEPGVRVLRGQPLAVAEGVSVHSPVSGKVKEIVVAENCEGVPATTVVVENDGLGESMETSTITDLKGIEAEELYQQLNSAGIVATFKQDSTFVRALPPLNKKINFILLHGCSHVPDSPSNEGLPPLLQEIISGLKVLLILYPEAEIVWQSENGSQIETILSQFSQARILSHNSDSPNIPVKWAIEEILGHPLVPGTSPVEEGLLPITFQQARAIHRAVFLGEPYMEQLVRVEGSGVNKPGYYQVPLGTNLGDVLISAEAKESQLAKVVVGCALNGTSVPRLDLPVGKSVSSIITFTADEVFHYQDRRCIHCGRCYEVCPLKLLPQRIAACAEIQNWEAAREEGVLLCSECGRCTYNCPAQKPLLQLIKLAKSMLLNQKN